MAAAQRRILIIQGHPDGGGHYCHALAEEYTRGARGEGHVVEQIEIGSLDIPFLRSRGDLQRGATPAAIKHVQSLILASDHVLLIHPLWNGGAPAMLRAFMEQAFRPSFLFPEVPPEARLSFAAALTTRKALKGKTARVIVTMQMPVFIHRWVFRPHQEANALWLAGARPVRQTAIGAIESKDPSARQQWLHRVFELGRQAA